MKVDGLYKGCSSAPFVKVKLKRIPSMDFELLVSSSKSTEKRGGEDLKGIGNGG